MDLLEAIKGRRSIRAYRHRDVSEEIVEKLIDAARWAPSAGNHQPWEFIVVRKPETVKALSNTSDEKFIEGVPVVIVVCADQEHYPQCWSERARFISKTLWSIQDTAAAIQNILLVAYFLGLGTCWVGGFREQEVKELLKIPHGIRSVAMIPVGYPAHAPLPPKRRTIDQIVHREVF